MLTTLRLDFLFSERASENFLSAIVGLLPLFEALAALATGLVLLMQVSLAENLINFEPLHELAHSREVNECEETFTLGVEQAETLINIALVEISSEPLRALPELVLGHSSRLGTQAKHLSLIQQAC